jgi:hypothetical protein
MLRTAATTATPNRKLTQKLFFKIDLPRDWIAMLPPMRHAHFSCFGREPNRFGWGMTCEPRSSTTSDGRRGRAGGISR